MFDFTDYINTLNTDQLRVCQALIRDTILSKSNNKSKVSAGFSPIETVNINDFVQHPVNFVPGCDRGKLLDELRSLKLNTSSSPGKITNTYISLIDEDYTWESSHGPVVNTPRDLNQFPIIKSLLEKINNKYDCDLNSALVTHFKTGEASIRLHDDDEVEMDPSQPICVVSIGANRKVEFVNKNQNDFRYTTLSFEPEDSSLYVMRPGCQKYFLHRVRKNKRIKNERFSISFRRFIPAKERAEHVTNTPSNQTAYPALNLMDKFESSPIVSTTNTVLQSHSSTNKMQFSDTSVPGYSPFSRDIKCVDRNDTATSKTSCSKNKFCVIFGTSITENVDGDILSRKSRKVINCSVPGAKIGDIRQEIQDFCADNPGVINHVDRVILCIGVNDIKFFDGIRYDIFKRFRSPLTNLVKLIKYLLPEAQVIIKCVLPMTRYYRYIVQTIHDFNLLLLEICGKNGCIFLDCFADFLDYYGCEKDDSLYRDRWHLNGEGLKVLCRALKFAIYQDIFNPYMRTNRSHYYYLEY